MKEWVLGITDNHPSTWKRAEPLWQDETIVATSEDSFLDVMAKLCETAIAFRREYGAADSHLEAHLWNLKIQTYEDLVHPEDEVDRMDRLFRRDDSDGEDDSDDDEERGYQGKIVIKSPQEAGIRGLDFDDSDSEEKVSATTKLSQELLPEGNVIKVTYDYGSTTILYLKVLSIKSAAVRKLLSYLSVETNKDDLEKKLTTVPAYHLPEEEQVDHFFPNMSKAFLGYYVPIFSKSADREEEEESVDSMDSDDDDDYDSDEDESSTSYNEPGPKKVISSATMGLSSRVRREEDTVFCTMEDRISSSDLLFCPDVMDPNELLLAAEQAWTPSDRSHDPHGLKDYRYDYISRWIVASSNQKGFEEASKVKNMAGYGNKMVLVQLPENHLNRETSTFSFEKTFPKTYAMLTCGKFRWFQYKKGILRILVGRGVGNDHRSYQAKQILKTYKHDFESFHELLCAVEASWVWKGTEMTAETVIPEFDTFLGPSRPAPKVAELIAKEQDAVVISSCQDSKKLVTALAISEDPGGKLVVHSGHDDGTLSKWSLEDSQELWSSDVFEGDTSMEDLDDRYFDEHVCVEYTPGVAGIVVRPDPNSKGRHTLYVWSDCDESTPESTLKSLSGENGSHIYSYSCGLGNDKDGNIASPSISTVVFCRLEIEGELIDTILVGMHCLCSTLDCDTKYTNFDFEKSKLHSEGNIIPFYEHVKDATGRMDTWRGHRGMIRAMAVVEQTYLCSYSIRSGHGLPDAMILWSLQNPGVPLYRLDLWDPSKSIHRQTQTRLHNVCGISTSGKDLLFCDEYGRRVAAATVFEKDGAQAELKIRGFASTERCDMETPAFHGRMAMSESFSATATEWTNTIWLFNIETTPTHPKLDQVEGNSRDLGLEVDQVDAETADQCMGREISIGRIEVPLWGGNVPSSRKQPKRDPFETVRFGFGSSLETDRETDRFGEGGPISIAVRGKWLVAGFSNGTITRTILPEKFKSDIQTGVNSNHVASCSYLSSSEWGRPILAYNENDFEEGEQPKGCQIS